MVNMVLGGRLASDPVHARSLITCSSLMFCAYLLNQKQGNSICIKITESCINPGYCVQLESSGYVSFEIDLIIVVCHYVTHSMLF